MKSDILKHIESKVAAGKKSLALLLDPDKLDTDSLRDRILAIKSLSVDYIFVGGSLISSDNFEFVINSLKQYTDLPVIIFPGNGMHIYENADAILLLQLISGRNPDFLIGQHVIAAPKLKRSNLEILPTGYMLVESGVATTVSYISNTTPLPANKPDIAACTAIAGEMLGLKLIYMDAGSGAQNPINQEMIAAVKKNVGVPLIVGGGINTVGKAIAALEAGADVIVIGNAVEKDPGFLNEVAKAVQKFNISETANV
jgi:geranylgeranylglyceryl phosphate synthase family protein